MLKPLKFQQDILDCTSDLVIYSGCGAGKSTVTPMLFDKISDDPKSHMMVLYKTLQHRQHCFEDLHQQLKLLQPAIKDKYKELKLVSETQAKLQTHYLHNPYLPKAGYSNIHDITGYQLTSIVMESANLYSEREVRYAMSRLRSPSQHKPQMYLATTPVADTFIYNLVHKAGYLDENGYPIPELYGKHVYCCFDQGEFVCSHNKNDLITEYGFCITLSYFWSSPYDNPYLQDNYLGLLEALPDLDRERLIHNRWS